MAVVWSSQAAIKLVRISTSANGVLPVSRAGKSPSPCVSIVQKKTGQLKAMQYCCNNIPILSKAGRYAGITVYRGVVIIPV